MLGLFLPPLLLHIARHARTEREAERLSNYWTILLFYKLRYIERRPSAWQPNGRLRKTYREMRSCLSVGVSAKGIPSLSHCSHLFSLCR